jgi:hypothetical protein
LTDEPKTLEDVFDDLAEQLGEVEAVAIGEAIEYRRRGNAFAVVDGHATAELRLDVEVAEAARRTPATSASGRGVDWVRLSPRELDGPTLDRAEAWFLSAWRAAERRPR